MAEANLSVTRQWQRYGAGEKFLTVFWIGSLWTIGYLVAPTLFRVLDDRVLAGMIAGRLFTLEAYIGLLCGGLLLLLELARGGVKPGRRVLLLLGLLTSIGISEFAVHPVITDLKVQGLTQSDAFARWHGVSALLYLVTSLLGLAWVIFAGPWQQSNEVP